MCFAFRSWRYSAQGIKTAREDLNKTAVKNVQALLREEYGESHQPEQQDVEKIQYLSVSDELSLVAYYLAQLVRLAKAFNLPLATQSTAMTYLKRFYLRNTCMDYHPKNVM